jgi:hypothetical protein
MTTPTPPQITKEQSDTLTQAAYTKAGFSDSDTPEQTQAKLVLFAQYLADSVVSSLDAQAADYQPDTTITDPTPAQLADQIEKGIFAFDQYTKPNPLPLDPIIQSPAEAFTVCAPGTPISSAAAQNAEYYQKNVDKVIDTLSGEIAKANASVDKDFISKAQDVLTSILQSIGTPESSLTETTTDGLKTTQKTTPANLLTMSQVTNYLTGPTVITKAQIEASLKANGIYIVNGKYLKEGDLVLTCARSLGRLLGAYDCDTMGPYLTKDSGTFTLIVTYKKMISTSIVVPCGAQDANMPDNPCKPITEVVVEEVVLGTNISIDSILATNPSLTRSDLLLYVFWNDYPNPNTYNQNALGNLGLTNAEITNAFAVQSVDALTVCVIADCASIYSFLCANKGDPVLLNGPYAVDPNPDTDDLINDVDAKTQIPSTVTGGDGVTRADTNNPALNIFATLDPNKTFPCQGAILAFLGNAAEKVDEAATYVDDQVNRSNGSLSKVQDQFASVGNKISKFAESIQKFIDSDKSGILGCLLQGAGATIGLKIPTDLLSFLANLLQLVFNAVTGLLRLLENLLLALLNGFCLSISMLSGVLGAAVTLPAFQCFNFEIPWPDVIKTNLACLLKILQLIQKIINRALDGIRNLFLTLQNLALNFNLFVANNVAQCNPAAVIGLVTAIGTQVKAFT